ncbi:hypothetical protein JVX90_14640 [Gordonia sp. PDNC005]|uniref:hypothetical protein n=1 Tax=unclassified Gordonia (in: high G+C Gram-positive bacteria) TaxID=2657482 RepID=UPI001965C94E|nr:hypothetical protein [Gordonia sp. PDNC005]QRY61643.1 hypothetical protein JVX90_14640 [Gordonia sp. PDNC005]
MKSTKFTAALLSSVAAVAMLLAPGTADASPTAPIGQHQVKNVGPAGAKFTGVWVGHTRKMSLNKNGWGYMTLFSGASNGAKHLVSWGTYANGNRIRVRLNKRVQTWGTGVPMRNGRIYTGGLVRSTRDGTVFMSLGGANTWCNQQRFGYAMECGA